MNNKIKLLHITPSLTIGGLERVVVNLCKFIDRDIFHVSVLCLRGLGPFAEEIEQLGIKVTLLDQKRDGTDYLSFMKVAKTLAQGNIQVIHTHNTQPLIDGTLGSILSKGRYGIVHTEHGREFPDKRRYMFAEWCMSHFVHKFVAVSDNMAYKLRIFEKISSKKLMTIDNGIDDIKFDIIIDQDKKRKELGLPANCPVIGIISRLERVKGIKYLIHALPKILKVHKDLRLLIVGDGSEKEQLQAECRHLDIAEHVLFCGNRLDIPEIFQVLDIYLLPSLSEGLPMGLIEAMAAGRPIVASKVGGIPAAVQDMCTALLVSPGNSKEIADAVLALLANHELRLTLSSNATELFKKRFSAVNMTRKYSELYEKSLRC